MNPLNNVIFAQRVIAFSAIKLQQPLLCTLVTPTWAEAVFDYGAAALAWKRQIFQSPEDEQTNGSSFNMKAIDMIDEDDEEKDLGFQQPIQQKRAARFAAHQLDTPQARIFKAKKFLFRLLSAGQGRLQAWALEQLISDAIGYFSLLPPKKTKKKANDDDDQEDQNTNNGGWGMAAAQSANTNENLDVDPEHWQGALIKQLVRGQWAEGARVLLLDPRVPRPSATADEQHQNHFGWNAAAQPKEQNGEDEKIPPFSDLLLFAAKSKDRSGNVMRLFLTDMEIHEKVGDFTNEYVVNTMFRDDWKSASAITFAGVADNPTTVRLLLEAGAEMKILVKNRPWSRRRHNNNNNQQRQVRRLRHTATGQMSSLIVNVIEANCADALREILNFLRDTQGQEALDDLFYKTGQSRKDLRENVKYYTSTTRPGISIPNDATFASSIAAMKEGEFAVLSMAQNDGDSESMPQFIATRQMRRECLDVLLREFKVDPNFADWGSGLYGSRSSLFCSVITRLAQLRTFHNADQDRNGTSYRINMFGGAAGGPNASPDDDEQKAKELIRFMIDECGADVNGFDKKRNVQGKNPLRGALEGQGDLALVKYLIEECGADPFRVCDAPTIRSLISFTARVPYDKEGRIKDRTRKFSVYSPAWGAPARTREEDEKEEDDYPFDVELSRFSVYALDKSDGSTFVHYVAEHGEPNVCNYLFKELPDKLQIPRSAVSNSCDALGQTPLFFACSRFPYFWQRLNVRVPDIVKLLVQECGALVDVRRHGDELQPIHCLTSLNADRDTLDDILAIFIQNGADINARTALAAGYDTPLHFYAAKGDRTMVRAALDAGANVNAKNTNNMTPIMAALTVMDRYSMDENGQYGHYCFNNGSHVWNIHAILHAGNRACPQNPTRSTFLMEQGGGAKINAEFDGEQDTTSLVDGMAPQSVYDLVEAVGKKGLSKVFRKERSKKKR